MIQKEQIALLPISWGSAWTSSGFTIRFVIAAVLLTVILTSYPVFFAFIQHRQGTLLHDPVLANIPSVDVSGAIFTFILITTALGLFRTLQIPHLFLIFLWGYVLLNLSRIVTITLFPLEPPVGLLSLSDPIAFPFYGHPESGLITKDLFYSGHTGTLFLIYLVLVKKWEKRFALLSTVVVGILLMVQHVHYTIDVIAAPFFVYFIFRLAKKIAAVA